MDYFQKMRENMAEGDKTASEGFERTFDKAKMNANPELQGPHLPEHTPEEDKYYGDIAQSMGGAMGSISPASGALAKLAGKAAPEAIEAGQMALMAPAKAAVVDAAGSSGPNVLAMPTQVSNTARMLSERTAQQLKDRKLAALKAIKNGR
jgi:hypothetical protein